MYPSFKNLADRRKKEDELLERVKRKVNQKNAKRVMFSEAIWASDAGKTVSKVSSTSETNIDMTEEELKDAIKSADPNKVRVMFASDKKKASELNVGDINANVETDNANFLDEPVVEPVVEPVEQEHQIVVIPPPDEQGRARGWIKSWYQRYPEWVQMNINPFKTDGSQERRYYIGERTILINIRSGQSGKPRNIDWIATKELIEEMDAIIKERQREEQERLRREEQERQDREEQDRQRREKLKNDQESARIEIESLFDETPELVGFTINPLKKNGAISTRYYLGKRGYLYSSKTNKVENNSRLIDWVATKAKVVNIINKELAEIRSVSKNDADIMIGPSNRNKRKDNDSEDSPSKRHNFIKEVRSKYTQSSHDQIDAKAKLMILIRTYKKDIEPFILNPEVKDGFEYERGKSKHDYSIRFNTDNTKLVVVSNETKKPIPTVFEAVDWRDTFKSFINIAESKGVDFGRWKDKELTANPDNFKYEGEYNLKRKKGDANTGFSFRLLEPESLSEFEAKHVINEYYKALTDYGLSIPFRLNPIIRTRIGQKMSQKIDTTHYFAEPEGEDYLVFRTTTQPDHPLLSPSKNEAKLKRVIWGATLDSLLAGLERMQQFAFENDSTPSQKKEIERSLKTFNEVIVDLKLNIREPMGRGLNKHLKGRGLKGAGRCVYQFGVERRGKYYNLNDIQGTGLASAYVYQKIGSKYIRIPDLENNVLNIVYPSRRKLGPKRDISNEVKNMIKDLVYDSKLSQDAFDKLNIEDKRLFKEVLTATHINNTFRDDLPDPLNTIRAEYDKLKGEVLLGNDNPSIITQLKTLVVEMFANKLIDSNEFKQVIASLI
jgi:hypothetical protein